MSGPPAMIRLGPQYPARIFRRPTTSGGYYYYYLTDTFFNFYGPVRLISYCHMGIIPLIQCQDHGSRISLRSPRRHPHREWVYAFLGVALPSGPRPRSFPGVSSNHQQVKIVPVFPGCRLKFRAGLSRLPDTLFLQVFPCCQVKQLPPPGNEPGHALAMCYWS